ncbi:MAG TPA: hypothetical protein PKA82_01245 [Pyrinomonadaceae bacterium]|nr:hypothetical protein [Pyrinomonadaceae bacterium]
MIDVLIIGLIIVGLMVYASTRIKRISREAFEFERIETDQYVLEKPDGFLNVIAPREPLLLDGYSREFGEENASNIRRGTYNLVSRNGVEIAAAFGDIESLGTVVSDETSVIDGKKYRDVRVTFIADGIEYEEFYRLCGNADGSFVFKATMLADAGDEVSNAIVKMLASFQVK